MAAAGVVNGLSQPKNYDWKLAIEGLSLNVSNWTLETECERLQLKGWDRSYAPKLATEGKGLQMKGGN